MTTTSTAPDLVRLLDGPFVPLAALQCVWQLEARGFHIRTDAGHLVVSPGSYLTDTDRTTIRRYRGALVVIVTYVDQMPNRDLCGTVARGILAAGSLTSV